MLSKNKSRPITVRNNRFRYAISCSWKEDGLFDFNITIQSEVHNGSKLLAKGLVTRDFWLDFPEPENDPGCYPVITPRHIHSFIERGIEDGWDYTAKTDFTLKLLNETVFSDI